MHSDPHAPHRMAHTQSAGHRVSLRPAVAPVAPSLALGGYPVLLLWFSLDMGSGARRRALLEGAARTCDVHEEGVGEEVLATPGGLTLQVQGIAQQRCGHTHATTVVPHHLLPIRPQCRVLLQGHGGCQDPFSWPDQWPPFPGTGGEGLDPGVGVGEVEGRTDRSVTLRPGMDTRQGTHVESFLLTRSVSGLLMNGCPTSEERGTGCGRGRRGLGVLYSGEGQWGSPPGSAGWGWGCGCQISRQDPGPGVWPPHLSRTRRCWRL